MARNTLLPEQTAGTAAGESESAHSQPAETGASRKESEMNIDSLQLANSDPPLRSLKVEAIGDFARRKVIPRIRVAGQWLEQAGFKPGHRVEVRLDEPGTLTLRFLAESAATESLSP